VEEGSHCRLRIARGASCSSLNESLSTIGEYFLGLIYATGLVWIKPNLGNSIDIEFASLSAFHFTKRRHTPIPIPVRRAKKTRINVVGRIKQAQIAGLGDRRDTPDGVANIAHVANATPP
jgi:hypothetical protein